MRVRIASFAVLLAAVSVPNVARAVASAELYHTQPYVYGRFEARIRYAPADGVISSFFLWKEGSNFGGAFWNELDFEKLGAECHLQTNALYGNPVAGHEQVNSVPGGLCSSYHDYRFDWTPTYIAWAVDGQEIRRESGEVVTAFSEHATNGMRIHLNVWPGDETFGGNFDPASLPVHQYISWVQYSSYSDGNFQLEWQQQFDGTSPPSGWAVGTWTSPLGHSTHSSQNVAFVDGICILSLTADDATGFSGTPPPDDGNTGGAGTGGVATGGTNTGGAATGGSNTGGVATGGSNTGGVATGGSNTGGVAAAGAVMPGGTGIGGAGIGAENGGTPQDGGCACRARSRGAHDGRFGVFGTLILLLLCRRRSPAPSASARVSRRPRIPSRC
jgi:endo-1,3-1,4-beta-glycanase ExoK